NGGIPSSLTYTVARSRLTTVRARLYESASGNGCTPELYPLLYSFGFAKGLGVQSAVTPGDHTDYWYTSEPDQVLWQTAHYATDCTIRYDEPRHIKPGEQIGQTWNKAPLAPAPIGPPALGGALSRIE